MSDDSTSVCASSSSQDFQDANADVRILSSDGQVFNIQSYYLMAGSVVLRNMVEVARPKESSSDDFDQRTVEIDAPGESVSLFLHLFIGTPPPDPALERIKKSTMLDVIRLVEKFDCIIRDRLQVRIRIEAEHHGGWDSFVYAARIDDKVMAKKVLSCMTDLKLLPGGFNHEKAEELPFPYFLALVNAVMKASGAGNRINFGNTAHHFSP